MLKSISNNLWRTTNLRPKATGLPMLVFVQPNTYKTDAVPFILVQTVGGDLIVDDKIVPIEFSRNGNLGTADKLEPHNYEFIKAFVGENLADLLLLWDDEISPTEFAERLKPIK